MKSARPHAVDVGAIERAIERVIDPCSIAIGRPQNLIEMGLLDELACDEAGRVTVALVLTDPACFFFRDIARFVTDAILEVSGVTAVDVEIVRDKMWMPVSLRGPTAPVPRK